jgi:hypothetical protein
MSGTPEQSRAFPANAGKTGPSPAWLSRLRQIPAKWRRRTWIERRLLIEAAALLGVARVLVRWVPFRRLAPGLGQHMQESPATVPDQAMELARLVGQAVRSAAANTPWQSVCLPQAMVGQWMLQRRNIPATLYLGVRRDAATPKKFAAHAWLRCGGEILTGAAGREQYTVVGTYAGANRRSGLALTILL